VIADAELRLDHVADVQHVPAGARVVLTAITAPFAIAARRYRRPAAHLGVKVRLVEDDGDALPAASAPCVDRSAAARPRSRDGRADRLRR
jgi:hypothetical protein